MFGAIAHIRVEIVNKIRPVMKIFARSNVSESFPIGKINAAEKSKKIVITRFKFSAVRLNFLAISGAAILTALDIKGTKNEEVVVAKRIFLLILCSSLYSMLLIPPLLCCDITLQFIGYMISLFHQNIYLEN
jgi:hypothetical protein